jgi:hypothetical protein
MSAANDATVNPDRLIVLATGEVLFTGKTKHVERVDRLRLSGSYDRD